MTEANTDLERARATLTDLFLSGAPRSKPPGSPALIDELLSDWDREAGDGEFRADVLSSLETDLRAAVAGKGPAERLERLRFEVVERRARTLSRESLALGQAVIDGTVDDDEAKAKGRALLERLEALRPRVAALVDPQGRALVDRMLEDVFLEALYAVERKAMSMRLGRYQQDRAVESGESNGSPGPPNISP